MSFPLCFGHREGLTLGLSGKVLRSMLACFFLCLIYVVHDVG